MNTLNGHYIHDQKQDIF